MKDQILIYGGTIATAGSEFVSGDSCLTRIVAISTIVYTTLKIIGWFADRGFFKNKE